MNNTWRAKQFVVSISGRRKLYVTIRRFRTSSVNRSKKYNQKVISLDLFGIREVAVRQKLYSKRTNRRAKNSHKLSYGLMAAGLVGLAYFAVQLAIIGSIAPPLATAQSIKQTASIAKPHPQYLSHSVPTHIYIPSIGVDTDIVTVSQQEDGSVGTPDLFSGNVGWYDKSPTPGEMGPAILDGHVDTYKGPSVFWNLGKVAIGDTVEVQRSDKRKATFEITSIQQFDQSNFPTDKVYGNIDHAGLRLITCGGTFNYVSRHYNANTVVFAELKT